MITVDSIIDNSEAQQLGLQPGDLIVKCGNWSVARNDTHLPASPATHAVQQELVAAIHAPGPDRRLTVLRQVRDQNNNLDWQPQTFTIKAGDLGIRFDSKMTDLDQISAWLLKVAQESP